MIQLNRTPIRIFIDMDGVMCDIAAAYQRIWADNPEIQFPQSVPGIFLNLDPIAGAKESIARLRQDSRFDVWILSAPSVRNPHCYTEKRLWVEKHFDYAFAKRLVLATDKGLLKGDVLVDDFAEGKGQDRFEGLLIQFGTAQYPDWDCVEAALYAQADQSGD